MAAIAAGLVVTFMLENHRSMNCAITSLARSHAMRGWVLFTAVLISCWMSNPSSAQTDPWMTEATGSRFLLRWENVERTPQVVSGIFPSFHSAKGVHVVHLKPGWATTLRVPARSMVRVVNPYGKLNPDDIEIWLSNGSGLFRKQVSCRSMGEKSLILVPNQETPMIARVSRPAACDCPMEVAIYTSRFLEEDGAGYPCRNLMDCGTPVAIHSNSENKKIQFAMLRPGIPAQIKVSGPARLLMETRLQYESGDSSSSQPYQIAVRMNGDPIHLLECETSPEFRGIVRVDGIPTTVGVQRSTILKIPSGEHQLELATDVHVYARITAAMPADFKRAFGFSSFDSIWDDRIVTQAEKLLTEAVHSRHDRALLAMRSARDNQFPNGGLRAFNLMKGTAAQHWRDLASRTLWGQIRNQHTFYRNLLPSWKRGTGAQECRWFFTRRLLKNNERSTDLYLSSHHIDDAVNQLSMAQLTAVAGDRENANIYFVPTGLGNSVLRLIVDRRYQHQRVQLMVQYDDRTPIEFLMNCTPTLRLMSFAPARAEAAIACIDGEFCTGNPGTLGAPFARLNIPAEIGDVATSQMMLPAGVKQIRVWSNGGVDTNIKIGLQYRASKPYKMTESAYLRAALKIVDPRHTFVSFLSQSAWREGDAHSLRELRNHWHFTIQDIRKSKRRFQRGTVKQKSSPGNVGALPDPNWREQLANADAFAASGDLLSAVEIWSDFSRQLGSPTREKLMWKRVDALLQLGEFYLAELELKGLYLYSDAPHVQEQAYEKLLDLYTQWQDLDRIKHLLSFEISRKPTYASIRQLAQTYADLGNFEFALNLCLVLPPSDQPHELVARCAHQLRWWRTLLNAASQLGPERKHYWLAHYRFALNQFQFAESHLTKAGKPGQRFLRHVGQGRAITRRLRSSDVSERSAAVFDWERWQATHPGRRLWREDRTLVSRFAGAESLYSVEQGAYSLYYRSRNNAPLQLNVLGPVRLRFEVRGLPHLDGSRENDWLHIRFDGRDHLFHLENKSTVGRLHIVGNRDVLPSRATHAELAFGPGLHQVELAAETIDILVRCFVHRCETPIPILPPLNRDTLDAVLTGRWGKTLSPDLTDDSHIEVYVHSNKHLLAVHPLRRPDQNVGSFSTYENRHKLGEILTARVGLRLRESAPSFVDLLTNWSLDAHSVAPEERLLALHKIGQLRQHYLQVCQENIGISPWIQQAICLGIGDRHAALAVPCNQNELAITQRLAILIRESESQADDSRRFFVSANQWFAKNRSIRSLNSLGLRLTSNTDWKSVTEIESSSGLHRQEFAHGQPESPYMRIRKALLHANDSKIISGSHRFVLGIDHASSGIVRFSLKQLPLSFLSTEPVMVVCQLDEKVWRRFELSARASLSTEFDVPVSAGRHRLSLSIEQPRINQFVSVRAHVVQDKNPVNIIRVDQTTTRTYHVATPTNPIQIPFHQPTWLRVDRLDGNRTISEYRSVWDTDTPFMLHAHHGKPTRYRVFECQHSPNRLPPTPEDANIERLPLPLLDGEFVQSASATEPWMEPELIKDDTLTPLSLLPADTWAEDVYLNELFPLIGQEDGTIALGMGYVQRQPIEEEPGNATSDEFIQWNATHYLRDDWKHLHHRSQVLIRDRDQYGSTFGANYEFWKRSPHWPFTWNARIYGFLQDPNAAMDPFQSSVETSMGGHLRWTKRRELPRCGNHQPTLTLFGRWLSADGGVYPSGSIDQDVFTDYKANHRSGMRLSDKFVMQRCDSIRWWFRPSVGTNENFNPFHPDHATLQIGRAQWFGIAGIEFSYRYTRYFADDDRSSGVSQHIVYLDAVAERWTALGHRWELQTGVRHDLVDDEATFHLTLVGYFDRGRLYRDLAASESMFLSLRHGRALRTNAERNWQHD